MDNEDLIDLNEEIELQDDNSQALDIIMEIMAEIGDGNYLGMDEFMEMVA
jgi:hypothetical protein